MKTFSALLAVCAGNSPVTVEFPSQRPVTRRALMFSLICALNKRLSKQSWGWYLRRHRAKYDVVVMSRFNSCRAASFLPFLNLYIASVVETSLMKDMDTLILHCKHHGIWCPGGARNQGIRGHGIDIVFGNIPVSVPHCFPVHYSDVIMGPMASQITSLTIVYSTVYSDADQRKHQSSGSLARVRGIHRWSVNSPHKWPVTRKMCPFDDVIMFPVSVPQAC